MFKRILKTWKGQWLHPIRTAKAEPVIFWTLQAVGAVLIIPFAASLGRDIADLQCSSYSGASDGK